MNVKYVLSFETLLDCINNKDLAPHELIAIKERWVEASDESLIDPTFTTVMHQVRYCTVCLYKCHRKSKCAHTTSPDTLIHIQTAISTTDPWCTRRTDRPEGSRYLVRTYHLWSPNGIPGNPRMSSTGQPQNSPFLRRGYSDQAGSPPRRPSNAHVEPN